MINQKKSGVWLPVFLSLLGLLFSSGQVIAAGSDNQVLLTVSQTMENGGQEVFTYQLEALESGSPLPPGKVGDQYSFTLSGSQTITLEALVFQAVGEYHYRLSLKESEADPAYEYDTEVYTITVYVTEASGGLRADVVAEGQSGLKTEELSYGHRYIGVQEVPPKAGDTTGPVHERAELEPEAASQVRTGDAYNAALWLAAAIAALLIASGIIWMGRRRTRD